MKKFFPTESTSNSKRKKIKLKGKNKIEPAPCVTGRIDFPTPAGSVDSFAKKKLANTVSRVF